MTSPVSYYCGLTCVWRLPAPWQIPSRPLARLSFELMLPLPPVTSPGIVVGVSVSPRYLVYIIWVDLCRALNACWFYLLTSRMWIGTKRELDKRRSRRIREHALDKQLHKWTTIPKKTFAVVVIHLLSTSSYSRSARALLSIPAATLQSPRLQIFDPLHNVHSINLFLIERVWFALFRKDASNRSRRQHNK